MVRFGRAGGLVVLGALCLALAGCSSLGVATPGRTAADLAGTDLATAVFAIDMPLSIEPIDGPRVRYGAALDVTLIRADAESVMAVLPPPPEGRSYAIYAFAAEDQAKVRAAQAAAVAGRGAVLAVAPRLCATSDMRRDRDTVTVLAVVPGQRPVTIVGPETIAMLESRTGAPLPACAGHSG